MKYNSDRSKLAQCLMTGVCAALLAASSFCAASEQPTAQDQGVGQNISQAPVQVASILQVSGSTTHFTISAQHADVKNALKLIFDQAHRQFAPDGSVAGNITLALAGQPFSVALAAVCRQTFLRWTIDKNGIYQITRDDEAVRQLVARTRMVNALLRDQLARLGYDVPGQSPASQQSFGRRSATDYSGAMQNNANALSMDGAYAGNRAGGSRRGAVGQSAPAATMLDSKVAKKAGQPDAKTTTGGQRQVERAVAARAQGSTGPPGAMGRPSAATENGSGQGGSGGASGGFGGSVGGGGAGGGFGGGGGGLGGEGSFGGGGGRGQGGGFGGSANDILSIDSSIVNDPVKYRAFLKENGLVSIIIPRDKPRAVTDVLLELSQQSNVPILIDPSIPRGYRFRLTGSIAPCSLPEALSLLSIPAHLEVRYIANSILVSAKPEFQVYFGESTMPRAYYGNTQNANQNPNGQGGQQAAPGQTQSLPAAATKVAAPPKVQQKDKKPSVNP